MPKCYKRDNSSLVVFFKCKSQRYHSCIQRRSLFSFCIYQMKQLLEEQIQKIRQVRTRKNFME
jgi:hypothetical protein